MCLLYPATHKLIYCCTYKNVIICIIWRDTKKNTKKEFVSQSLRNIKLTEINGHRLFFGHKIKTIHCMIKKHFKRPVVKRLNIVQQYKLLSRNHTKRSIHHHMQNINTTFKLQVLTYIWQEQKICIRYIQCFEPKHQHFKHFSLKK